METVLDQLLKSNEPAIRYKTYTKLLGREPDEPDLQALQLSIRKSERVQTLLSERDERGEIPHHAYAKWRGSHWVLACLADLGYPPGDDSLMPILEQVYNWLLSKHHLKSVKIISGRARRCASQEGNALYYALALGLADDRTGVLVKRLIRWQWPDGGWNCDKRWEARNSSFFESLIPLRALALYGRATGDREALLAAENAAEIFLKRELFKRQSDGGVIDPNFITLHYPCYWRYDVLFGLKVMLEAGYLDDPRCQPALDLLDSKQLAGGGFPAEKKYYRVSNKSQSGGSLVDWGGTSARKMNEFVTFDALHVLQAAGRFDLPEKGDNTPPKPNQSIF